MEIFALILFPIAAIAIVALFASGFRAIQYDFDSYNPLENKHLFHSSVETVTFTPEQVELEKPISNSLEFEAHTVPNSNIVGYVHTPEKKKLYRITKSNSCYYVHKKVGREYMTMEEWIGANVEVAKNICNIDFKENGSN